MNNIKLRQQLEEWYNEDVGTGDISVRRLFSKEDQGELTLLAKQSGIFCGEDIVRLVFELSGEPVHIEQWIKDGQKISAGTKLATITGPVQTLLTTERLVLNIIQRMSGIATFTHAMKKRMGDAPVDLLDTRKTLPGFRMLDKYAVQSGGGKNHRFGLYDAVMLKDNHIAAAGSIQQAVDQVRQQLSPLIKIEVEIETKAQLEEAVAANVDVILFDNRSPEEIRAWLPLVPQHIRTEASGMIDETTIQAYAQTGVDAISMGALTHSVKAFDISAQVKNRHKGAKQ